MLKLLGELAAMMLASAGTGGREGGTPIYLVAEPVDGAVRIKVMGASEAEHEAMFSLEVEAGGNKSRHSGSAMLRGGDPVTLSTVTVGVGASGRWSARLNVEPRGGDSYEQVRTSN